MQKDLCLSICWLQNCKSIFKKSYINKFIHIKHYQNKITCYASHFKDSFSSKLQINHK